MATEADLWKSAIQIRFLLSKTRGLVLRVRGFSQFFSASMSWLAHVVNMFWYVLDIRLTSFGQGLRMFRPSSRHGLCMSWVFEQMLDTFWVWFGNVSDMFWVGWMHGLVIFWIWLGRLWAWITMFRTCVGYVLAMFGICVCGSPSKRSFGVLPALVED